MSERVYDNCLAVKVPGRPGYISIGEDVADVRRDFEKQGTVVRVTRSEAIRGFHEYAASSREPTLEEARGGGPNLLSFDF